MPIRLEDTRSIPDVLSVDRYELRFPIIPLVGVDRELTIRCQQVQLPGVGNEAFEVKLNGHTSKYRGARKSEHTFSATFVEVAGGRTLQTLQRWHEAVVGTKSGSSLGYKIVYSVERVELEVFDTTGKTAGLHTLYGVFPENIDTAQLDSNNSGPLLITASFSFDYNESSLRTSI